GFAHLGFDVFDDGGEVGADLDLFFAVAALADGDGDVVAFVDRVHDVVDVAAHRLRGDVVFEIVGGLLVAAAAGFGQRAFHRAGDAVGIEHHLAVDVTRGAADGLDQ